MIMSKFSKIVKFGYHYLEHKLEEYQLGFPEQIILMHLAKHPNINQDSIAKQYMVDKGAIAKTIVKLEQKEMIQRIQNPENRRENLVRLSPKGEGIISHLNQNIDEWNQILYKGLTQKDQDELYRILGVMLQNVNQALEEEN